MIIQFWVKICNS